MDLSERLKTPPPRDAAALEPLLANARRRYYRWPLAALLLAALSTTVIALSLLFSSAASWRESLGQPVYALIVVALFVALPAWLMAWSRVRAMNRLMREGVVYAATVVPASESPGWGHSLTAAFAPDSARSFQVTVRLPSASAPPAAGNLLVVFAHSHAPLAAVVTADEVLLGRALPRPA